MPPLLSTPLRVPLLAMPGASVAERFLATIFPDEYRLDPDKFWTASWAIMSGHVSLTLLHQFFPSRVGNPVTGEEFETWGEMVQPKLTIKEGRFGSWEEVQVVGYNEVLWAIGALNNWEFGFEQLRSSCSLLSPNTSAPAA